MWDTGFGQQRVFMLRYPLLTLFFVSVQSITVFYCCCLVFFFNMSESHWYEQCFEREKVGGGMVALI